MNEVSFGESRNPERFWGSSKVFRRSSEHFRPFPSVQHLGVSGLSRTIAIYSFTRFVFGVFGSIQTVTYGETYYVLFLEFNVPDTFLLILVVSLGYPSPLLPEEGWNPGAVRTMDQRHGKFVIRAASWPCHITSRTVTKAEYWATETGTRQASTTPWSQGRRRGQWWGKWLNNNEESFRQIFYDNGWSTERSV